MDYPKKVTLQDDKLRKLLKEKEDLIVAGREKSQEIEDQEKLMEETNQEMMAVEKTVDVKDIEDRAKSITEEFNIVVAKMEGVKKEIYERMSKAVPQEMKDKHEAAKKTKEYLETQRNKIGLKVQQRNDKIIPLSRKLMRPFLEEKYDDFDTIRIENGQIVGTIFNHLLDWEKLFANRKMNN